jgi:mannitol-1-phosphate/altronate dehydrogenase
LILLALAVRLVLAGLVLALLAAPQPNNKMKHNLKKIIVLTFAGALAFLPLTLAQERPDHFKGKPAPTLEAALANLTEYNAKLEALLKQANLGPKELFQVHQLSYTLEMALEKLGQEQARLACWKKSTWLRSAATVRPSWPADAVT